MGLTTGTLVFLVVVGGFVLWFWSVMTSGIKAQDSPSPARIKVFFVVFFTPLALSTCGLLWYMLVFGNKG